MLIVQYNSTELRCAVNECVVCFITRSLQNIWLRKNKVELWFYDTWQFKMYIGLNMGTCINYRVNYYEFFYSRCCSPKTFKHWKRKSLREYHIYIYSCAYIYIDVFKTKHYIRLSKNVAKYWFIRNYKVVEFKNNYYLNTFRYFTPARYFVSYFVCVYLLRERDGGTGRVIIIEKVVCNVGCASSAEVNIACGFDSAKKA